MFTFKSTKIYQLKLKKGEIATFFTLFLLGIGLITTITLPFFLNKNKKIVSTSKAASSCSSEGSSGLCSSLNCCPGLTKVVGMYGYCQCSSQKACQPNETRCDGQFKETCKNDGSGWERKYCPYGCVNNDCQKTPPTPTKSNYPDLSCRCINGIWSGGGCDGWQIGKSCLPTGLSHCKKNGEPCSGFNDTSCCSGYCVPSIYGYYCQPASEVAKGCLPFTTKCEGNYLMKCINGAWVKDKLCSICQQTSSEAKCVEDENGLNDLINTQQNSTLSTVKGRPCTTRRNWPGKCTLAVECNFIAAGVAWDPGAPECKSQVMDFYNPFRKNTIYGCCGTKPNYDNLCSQQGLLQQIGEKCYACFLTDEVKKMVEVPMDYCKNMTSISNSEIMLKAVSTEDQYTLRQIAFDKFEKSNASFKDKIIAWAMEQADSLTYYTFGQLPKVFGGEAESSMGNYYVAQMEANAAAAAKGIERKVTVGQALTTGLIGGYKFANDMFFGIPDGVLNLVTGGRTRNWENEFLTSLYGAEEAAAAEKTITAGNDLTNIVSLLIPVGKSLSSVGEAMTLTAKEAEEAGKVGLRSTLLKGGGKIVSGLGEGLQILSPETWAANFIKEAPLTTALERGLADLKATKLVSRISQDLLTTTTKLREASPIIDKTFNIGSKIKTLGGKVVDFFLPKSALEYTPQELAENIARDIKLGIVDIEGVSERLATRYGQEIRSGAQIKEIIDELKKLKEMKRINIEEELISQLGIQLNKDLQNKLMQQALKEPNLFERIVNAIQGKPSKPKVIVVPDTHSDIEALQSFLKQAGAFDKEGRLRKDVMIVFEGDYFGKTYEEFIKKSSTPGFDILKKVFELQEEGGGRVVAQVGNWEPRVAKGVRLLTLKKQVEELLEKGDEKSIEEARRLLLANGFVDENLNNAFGYLKDEINRYLRLNKGPTGGLPISHEELDILTTKREELANLMGRLQAITPISDGVIVQHIDTPNLLSFAFGSREEVASLSLSEESKKFLLEMIEKRAKGTVLETAEDMRRLKKIFDELGWNKKTIVERINSNVSQIIIDGITRLDDEATMTNLYALEYLMSKELTFYNDPEKLIVYSEIFGEKGRDFRLVHGHSPLDDIRRVLSKNNSSAFIEVGNGVWVLKEDPRIVIHGVDVRLSLSMRFKEFFPVEKGVMKVPKEGGVRIEDMLVGFHRVPNNDENKPLLQALFELLFLPVEEGAKNTLAPNFSGQ